jgi:hypothetical protein
VAETRRRDFELEQARRQTRLEIETAWRQVKDQELFLAAAEKRLRAVESGYRQALDRGADGAMLLAEVLENEAQLRVTHADYFQKACALQGAVARLEAVAARDVASHLKLHELYTPDIPQPPSGQESQKVEVEVQPVHDVSSQSEPVPVQAGPENSQQYAVQLGAYKGRRLAERFKTHIQSDLPDVVLTVMEDGKLFKVVAGPFPSREAAFSMVIQHGIEAYMIKKWSAP